MTALQHMSQSTNQQVSRQLKMKRQVEMRVVVRREMKTMCCALNVAWSMRMVTQKTTTRCCCVTDVMPAGTSSA
jgi:small-conductance mechanosensitive channel